MTEESIELFHMKKKENTMKMEMMHVLRNEI